MPRSNQRKEIAFRRVASRFELAQQLDVPVKAISLVTLLQSECNSKDCPLSAVLNNYGKCILCAQRWFPSQLDRDGQPTTKCRGHGLYGPQFMTKITGKKSSPVSCCCGLPICESIGYSHEGMFHLPTRPDEFMDAVRVLGIKSAEVRREMAEKPKNHKVAPWHYSSRIRFRDSNGVWKIRKSQIYKDDEGKSYKFPPPNGKVQDFIDKEIPPIDHTGPLPHWVAMLARLQGEGGGRGLTVDTQLKSPPETPMEPRKNPRTSVGCSTPRSAGYSTPRPPRKRAPPGEHQDMQEEIRLLQAQLQSALSQINNLNATVQMRDDALLEIRMEKRNILDENMELATKLQTLQSSFLSYDDLRPGGKLSAFVKDFTYFPDFDCNDAFLDLINFTEGCPPGDGLCENLVRYSKVSVKARKQFNTAPDDDDSSDDDDYEDLPGLHDQRGDDEMSIDSEVEEVADTELDDLAEETILEEEQLAEDTSYLHKSGPKRRLSWKTEWLVYCFYVCGNISMRRTAALFGISATIVHNIVYAWANVLCLTLPKFFPVPTRSQMLRAYPKSVVKKFGHAQIFMLLDATEGKAEIASMKTVNSVLFSAYKHNSTMKWLVGCDPIGVTWDESISEGYPGSISDPVQTAATAILEQIPFGCATEVDKGFLIENHCALLGIFCIRPMKMLNNQSQQSKEDAALTQKVGKTRIPIEQANGGMKRKTTFFDRSIRIDQVGLADLIFRSGYLLQNFVLPFIQEQGPTKNDAGRPCKAEIRWYDGTDDGLVDVRPMIELWGTEPEIRRWGVLRGLDENKELSDTEISELVLGEDWPAQLRRDHRTKLNLNN